jgi:drug/metabolite transporter (DMT)-like permease
MRLIALTVLTMLAFAANSILTRMAIEGGHIDPLSFGFIRVAAGAAFLAGVVLLRSRKWPSLSLARLPGAFSLTIYMFGFSLAYISLDAGLGALILFGVVQIAMFAQGVLTGQPPALRQYLGAGVAFAGLLLALWPGTAGQSEPIGAALMVLAGLGWAAYTILGRKAADPLEATGANFILCLPVMAILLIWASIQLSPMGVLLGVICGGLTSGLGYALWYSVLPHMAPATAATVQLSVPVIAILAGVLFLGEALTLTLVIAALMVVAGVAWAIRPPASQPK